MGRDEIGIPPKQLGINPMIIKSVKLNPITVDKSQWLIYKPHIRHVGQLDTGASHSLSARVTLCGLSVVNRLPGTAWQHRMPLQRP